MIIYRTLGDDYMSLKLTPYPNALSYPNPNPNTSINSVRITNFPLTIEQQRLLHTYPLPSS